MRSLAADADIRAVFAARRTAHGPAVAVHARQRGDDAPARAAVVAGRKVGGAVARNRAKRRVRAVLHALSLPPGMDLVVVARSGACTEPFPQLAAQVEAQIARVEALDRRPTGVAP